MMKVYGRLRGWIQRYVHSDDPMAEIANTGALVVWTHLPFYPLLTLWFVGYPVWPSFLLWITLPVLFAVAPLSKHYPIAARILFALAGVANTLLALKAFGAPSASAWFLVPCLIVAAFFFRLDEWKISAPLTILCALVGLSLSRLGPPLHVYSPKEYAEFASLNAWLIGGLSLYLLAIAGWRHWKRSKAERAPA